MSKKLTAIIEASKTGFGVYADALPGITGYGKSVAEAKKNFQNALTETIEAYESEELPKHLKGNLDFVYKYDVASIFNYFDMLDTGGLAKRIGMNPSLLRQYKGKHAYASDKQKQKIQEGLHSLGKELLKIRL